jgi:lipid-A-disaccharide synthase
MKYFIIAGERSGDLHAGNLIKALKDLQPNANFSGMGGEYLQAAGLELVVHYKEVSFMGFIEVLLNLSKISKVLKIVKKAIDVQKPDAIILVDFAGFNLKIAKYAKTLGIPVYYYISPKIWAWNQSRVHTINKLVDQVFVILPFEKDFFAKFGCKQVEYVGNPLLDSISAFQKDESFRSNFPQNKSLVVILAGSRKQEVLAMADKVNAIVQNMPNCHFVVAAVDNLAKDTYKDFLPAPNLEIVFNQTYNLLSCADASITTSGTATLETALFECPQVVVYKTSAITYQIAKRLIKVPYISLVNLIAGKELVKELIQNEFSSASVKTELQKILPGGENRNQMLQDYQELMQLMGQPGASSKTANLILQHYQQK